MADAPQLLTRDQAYAFCRQFTKSHYENFPVAGLWFSKDKRNHIAAVYTFLRTADDLADQDVVPVEHRLHALLQWESKLHACYEGEADDPVFVALSDTVRALALPKSLFLDCLNAFKVDLFKTRYRAYSELAEYCEMSANPVGRLMLHIMGYRSDSHFEEMVKASDAICTALQLTNHWQDIFVDIEKGRLYLPTEEMERFQYHVSDWHKRLINDRFRELMAFQIIRVRRLFDEGEALLRFLKRKDRMLISWMRLCGIRVIDKLVRSEYDMIAHRPRITAWDRVTLLLRSI